jgi:hypothetical protein
MRRRTLPACLPAALCLLALAGCAGSTRTSTTGFSGAKREVAERIADLQSNASSAEPKKICSQDLAAPLVTRLGAAEGCEAAIKSQLNQVDNLELKVDSVALGADGKTASAAVRSIHEGKTRSDTLTLVKEGGAWRISGL